MADHLLMDFKSLSINAPGARIRATNFNNEYLYNHLTNLIDL